jgi:hypothetical protein
MTLCAISVVDWSSGGAGRAAAFSLIEPFPVTASVVFGVEPATANPLPAIGWLTFQLLKAREVVARLCSPSTNVSVWPLLTLTPSTEMFAPKNETLAPGLIPSPIGLARLDISRYGFNTGSSKDEVGPDSRFRPTFLQILPPCDRFAMVKVLHALTGRVLFFKCRSPKSTNSAAILSRTCS